MSNAIRIILAAFDVMLALLSLMFGWFGVIGALFMLCAAFLVSPIPQKIPAFPKIKPGLFSILAFCTGFVFLMIGAASTQDDESSVPDNRIVITSEAPETETTTTAAETISDTDTETTLTTETTSSVETTTSFEIDLRSAELTTMSAAGDRGISAESSSSSSSTTKTTTSTTKTTTTTSTTSTTQSSTAAAALRVTSFPSIVYRNEDVTLSASGLPNTDYTLSVYYSSGASTADGLGKKTSDSNGNVSWSWQIGGRTNPGNYRMTIKGGGESITYNFTVGDS